MKLPDSIRDQFKNPLGVLLPEEIADKKHISEYLDDDSYLITVGDRTTEKMVDFGIIPSLQIIDGIEKRAKRESIKSDVTNYFEVDNPPAEITLPAIGIIKKAFSMLPPARIMVTGEEDLLVLPVCVHAPENSVVMYGQPNEGLVIVQVTSEIRNKAQKLLDLME
ncbi:MAG: GTP-dependent dephospho-CoA kinase family protein [Candidatus Nitrosopelagicus sp.]|nr:GTP-dependent dephospho-CoA kinase family protein [Candidatus Nitrosopelagicus sp.]